jgi:cytochrome c nitrite reductase small subunit
MLVGSSLVVLNYAEGLAYLSNDPAACTNCHIMQAQYNGWERSPHGSVATCNDCHTPHGFPDKYIAKARNGWNHSAAFTLQNFEEPIQIKPANAAILEENCRRCHEGLVNEITGHFGSTEEGPTCVHCHAAVGHGPTR